jgi:hypothetical protein
MEILNRARARVEFSAEGYREAVTYVDSPGSASPVKGFDSRTERLEAA